MVKKFFQLDKNYLLENAQHLQRRELLSALVRIVITHYHSQINPLGLEDSFSIRIKNYKLTETESLDNFYEKVCAIYRFKYGDNQLEFLWDGTDHTEYYKKCWKKTFIEWTHEFSKQDLFIQAVLDLTVFHPKNETTQLLENRMNHFIQKHFDIKFHKVKGMMVA